MRSTLIALVVVTGLAAGLAAQLPPGTRYAVASMQFTSGGDNEVAFVDGRGAITTVVKLGAGFILPGSIGNAATNRGVLVFDRTGVHTVDFISRSRTYTTLTRTSGMISWGCVDENGGIAWVTSTGNLYRADDDAGTNTTLVASGGPRYNTMAWDGATGAYFVAPYSTATTVRARFIARDGTVVRSVPFISSLTGADWDPWTGDMLVSRFGSQDYVCRIDLLGTVTSLGRGVPAIASTNSVEVTDQPAALYFCTEIGANPRGLYTLTPRGRIQTLSLTSLNLFRPADGCVAQARPLWGTGDWRIGRTGGLNLNFGWPVAGDFYQVALSLSHTPGIPLGPAGTLHLTPDPLFFASVAGIPGLFNHFTGRLTRSGTASPPPSVQIPGLAALVGLRIYGGAITYDLRGITQVSNAWGITLRA